MAPDSEANADPVFLSHSKVDVLQVRRLAEQLRQAGDRPWLDETDMRGGDRWDHVIRGRLRRCRHVVVCLSRDAVSRRGYFQKEISLALDIALEIPEGTNFVIPVRLEPCDVPERLSGLLLVDLFAPDGFEKLLFALREGSSGAAALIRSGSDEGERGDRPMGIDRPRVLHWPPDEVPVEIRDRVQDLAELRRRIETGDDRVIALTGPPGAGKTALVSRLFSAMTENPHGPFACLDYVAASGHLSVTAVGLIDALVQSVPDADERLSLVSRLLEQRVNWLDMIEEVLDGVADRTLLVLDQFDEATNDSGRPHDTSLHRLLGDLATRQDLRLTVLLVMSGTPDPYIVSSGAEAVLTLGGELPEANARELLADLTEDLLPVDRVKPRKLAIALAEGRPRNMELVVAALALDERLTVSTLAGLLVSGGAGGGAPEEAKVGRGARLIGHVVERLAIDEVRVVEALAVLGLPMTPDAVAAIQPDGPDSASVASTLSRLARIRVVRSIPTADAYYLPPDPDGAVVLERRRQQPDGEQAVRELVLRAADVVGQWKDVRRVRTVQDLALHFRQIRLVLDAGQPDRALQLMRDLDEQYLDDWGQRYALAPWRRELIGRLRAHQHERHNLSALANAARQHDDYLEAARCIEIALETLVQAPNERDALTLRLQLGDIAYLDGRLGQAAEQYRLALDVMPTDFDRTSTQRWFAAGALNGLANCLIEVARFRDADALLLEAETQLGQVDHLGIGTRHRLLARTLLARGAVRRWTQELGLAPAIELFSKAERLAAASDRELQARSLDVKAQALLESGDVALAVRSAEQASRIVSRGGMADLNRQANGTLALAYLMAGREEEAKRAAADATRLSRSRRLLGAHVLRGIVACRTKQYSEARDAFRQAVENARAQQGRAPEAFEVLDFLGLSLTGLAVCGNADMQPALDAYRQARLVSAAPGVRRRAVFYLDQLSVGIHSGRIQPARAAADAAP